MNSGKERSIDTFIAGLVGGYIVFGDRNAVNEQVRCFNSNFNSTSHEEYQIVLYVISRVLASFLPRANQPYNVSTGSARSASTVQPIPPDSKYFSVFAALSWGAVMYLFRHRAETIQPGMFSSMAYLYRDSEAWSDLRTLLWHNT
jgi:peroxisomal membrane protein 4